MENFVAVTSFLKEKIKEQGGDPDRETLTLIFLPDGRSFYTDEAADLWRLVRFVEGSVCIKESTPALLEASARAFGHFQRLLQDFPAEILHETIPHFHDTEDRFRKFLKAAEADAFSRAGEVKAGIRFVLDRRAECSIAMEALRKGKLPLRVTHNDTKLDNILFDAESGKALCVIDLDTVMPGLSLFDFGDSIRFGANHSKEDEPDLSRVNFDLELFERYTRGFLQEVGDILWPAELEYLPWGARIITLECGMRFLTDYLEGDHYFRTSYPKQNLLRCRTQFKLLRDMESQFTQMQEIVKRYAAEGTDKKSEK